MGFGNKRLSIAFDSKFNPVEDGKIGTSFVAPFRFVPQQAPPIAFQTINLPEYRFPGLSAEREGREERWRNFSQAFISHVESLVGAYEAGWKPEIDGISRELRLRLDAFQQLHTFLVQGHQALSRDALKTTQEVKIQMQTNISTSDAYKRASSLVIDEYLTKFSTDLHIAPNDSFSLGVRGITLLQTLENDTLQEVNESFQNLERHHRFLEENVVPNCDSVLQKIEILALKKAQLEEISTAFTIAKQKIDASFRAISKAPNTFRELIASLNQKGRNTDEFTDEADLRGPEVETERQRIITAARDITEILNSFVLGNTELVAQAFEICDSTDLIKDSIKAIFDNFNACKGCTGTLDVVFKLLTAYNKTLGEIALQQEHERLIQVQAARFLKDCLARNEREQERRNNFTTKECQGFPILADLLRKSTPIVDISIFSYPKTDSCICDFDPVTLDGTGPQPFRSTEIAKKLAALPNASLVIAAESSSLPEDINVDDANTTNFGAPSTGFIGSAPSTVLGTDLSSSSSSSSSAPAPSFDDPNVLKVLRTRSIGGNVVHEKAFNSMYELFVKHVEASTSALNTSDSNDAPKNLRDLIDTAQALISNLDSSSSSPSSSSPLFLLPSSPNPNDQALLDRLTRSIAIMKTQQELIDSLLSQ